MSSALNETHDAGTHSWVESAQSPGTDFPIQNLPFGIFRRRGETVPPRVGVAIGDQILDLPAAMGLLDDIPVDLATACASTSLNALMALGRPAATELRRRIHALLRAGSPAEGAAARAVLVSMAEAEMFLPARVGDYTDFYASVHHATNVGSMFRPDNPLLPNYKHVPIGYHGRASSLVPTGAPVRRPQGQLKGPQDDVPRYGASRLVDYESEVGVFIGAGNALGETIPLAQVEEHMWGLCLVNDWSARDIQAWEYQPLGPFLAKNFATTLSPWVVTLDALEPFRTAGAARPDGDPEPLPYLDDLADRTRGGFELTLEVWLRTERMRSEGAEAHRLSHTRFTDMYWTMGQMVTHHASNGCNLRPGDLLASGTVSGAGEDARGCMLELTWRGANPVTLPSGEERRFLEDGDEVVMRGFCERDGFARIGFGECSGVVVPASA